MAGPLRGAGVQPSGGNPPSEARPMTPEERVAGGKIMAHYRQQNLPEPLLMRVRNHLVYYGRHGGNMAELEQMVLSQNMAPQAVVQLIETRMPPPPNWAGPWGGKPGTAPGGPASPPGPRPGGAGAAPAPVGAPAPSPGTAVPPTPASSGAGAPRTCPYCGSAVDASATKCPGCTAPLR